MIADAPLMGVIHVWEQLVECMHDCNSYGGTVAEIYFYHLMNGSRIDPHARGIGQELSLEKKQNTISALLDIIRLFEREHPDVRVRMENGSSVKRYLKRTPWPLHRMHLKVVPR